MHTACPACWLHCPDNEHHEFRKHTYLVHKPIKVDTRNVSDDGYTSFKLDEISDKLDKWLQVQSNKYDKVSGKFDACSFMNILCILCAAAIGTMVGFYWRDLSC